MSEIKTLKAKDLSILFVEDEDVLRDKTASFLSKIFNHVGVAIDGKEGLDKYNDNKYDIVITDIHMPNMNGMELISNILKINKEQEIIISSAYSENELMKQALEYKNISHISKPIDINQLVEILNESIDKLLS